MPSTAVSLSDKAVEAYVLGAKKDGQDIVDKITDPEEKKVAKEKLDAAKEEWKNSSENQREAMTERYILQKYNLNVVDTISTNGKAGDAPEKSGSFFKTTVRIAEGDIPDDPNHPANMNDFRDKKHYESTNDNGNWKVDLDSTFNAGKDMMWPGPNTKFKVLGVKIEGHKEFGKGSDPYDGTNITIALLDKNGNITSRADIVHMTVINKKLIDAFKTGVTLGPGTWMGATPKKIGATSGSHLHIASFKPDGKKILPLPRKDFYYHWKGEKNK